MSIFYGMDGRKYDIGEQIGHGGEGKVFEIKGQSSIVGKIFYSPHAEMEEKLHIMLSFHLDPYRDGKLFLAWPLDILYSTPDRRGFAGYVMPKTPVNTKIYEIFRMDETSIRKRALYWPEYTWKYAIQVAYNLAGVVLYLHEKGIVVGDMNQQNIIVDHMHDGQVILVDCDSFHIRKNGKLYPCRVGCSDILPPEMQKAGRIDYSCYSRQTDVFQMAIHIFRLLMFGADPFGSINLGTPSASISAITGNQDIVQGHCLYYRDVPGRQPKINAMPPQFLPDSFNALFERTFNYTAVTAIRQTVIDRRPSAGEWCKALREYSLSGNSLGKIKTCRINRKHRYAAHNSECLECRMEKGDLPSFQPWSTASLGRKTSKKELQLQNASLYFCFCILTGLTSGFVMSPLTEVFSSTYGEPLFLLIVTLFMGGLLGILYYHMTKKRFLGTLAPVRWILGTLCMIPSVLLASCLYIRAQAILLSYFN